MRTLEIKVMALAAGLAFSSAAAAADGMSKKHYRSGKEGIDSDYKADKEACGSMAGNAKDICVAEAKGKAGVAKAELEARYRPTAKNGYKVRVARADAAYAVSIERCDDRNGNDKDVCVKEAKAAKVHSLADAKVWMETTQANHQANQISHQASLEAQETRTEVRRESADEKRDADYAVAKEKCDAMSGDAKDLCVSDAKSRFGQR